MSDHEAPQSRWEEHTHDAVVHSHRHFHVTHNHNKMTGGFDHLSSEHEHDHDHASVTHAHWPHENFTEEHEGEAHIHDHAEPVNPDVAPGAKAKPAAKKATGSRKKAAAAPEG